MKSAAQIVESVVDRIRSLYAEPENAVRDFGELDALLYTLHLLYADATDKKEEFVQVRWNVFERDQGATFSRIMKQKEAHRPIESVTDALELISEWKALDRELGLSV
jgi:hypothetical protein